ncbi:Peptidase-S9 domain-containing protein [Mycena chlorophos]|uniref:acylaminoacyl-peptidase n=1 Tax=Mycena chlorophos TaxID=658473 RepID=A0A8H6TNR1_MYCCL|nr:Peptidase-S9 domain-containing protein [Mycena chlorophos]
MYDVLSQLPVPKSGQFVSADTVAVLSTVRDNAKKAKRTILSSISANGSSECANEVDSDVVASIYAPKESICYPRRAVLRGNKTSKERRLEIWVGSTLEVAKDLTEIHGSIYTDDFLSGFVFSPSSYAFMYVAEAKEAESPAKYRFTPTLGETFEGKKRPTIFLFRWDPLEVDVPSTLVPITPSLPNNHTVLFGQPVFSPTSNAIYATGYEYAADGRLLGLVWCYNRPSGIWRISIPEADGDAATSCTKLTPADHSCRSTRVYHNPTPRQSTLVWLSHASGGPHSGTFSLQAADLNPEEDNESPTRTLVDTVWEPRTSDGFPGLYPESGNLPASAFLVLDDKPHLVLASAWGARTTILLVSLVDGQTTQLTPVEGSTLFSWSFLATDGYNRLLCSRSAPNVPREVVLGEVDATGSFVWKVLSTPYLAPAVKTALVQLTTSIIGIPERGKTETIVLRLSDSTTVNPCMQFIHGGPHSYATTAFSPELAAYALWGYTISSPNYNGSIGYGETSVRSLLGKCGTLDVEDCMATAQHIVKLGISSKGSGKQFVVGGSHGGFLAAHLVGQYPDFFTAAAMRNPVISANPAASDIPDWYFNEWAIEYPMFSSPLGFPATNNNTAQRTTTQAPPRRTPEESLRLFKTAPMAYVDAVKAHVLLHIGASDLRVTPTHGIDYYHALKGLGRTREGQQDVDMMVFADEGHPLDGVETSKVVWESTVHWFDKYRS